MYAHYFSGFLFMQHWGQVPPFELLYVTILALPCIALGYLGAFVARRVHKTANSKGGV